MRRITVFKLTIWVCGLFYLGLGSFSLSHSLMQEKEADVDKTQAEIIGIWEFDVMGEVISVEFKLREGKLICVAATMPEDLELIPVEGEALKFKVEDSRGETGEFEFVRDDSGKISRCTCLLQSQGLELQGTKIKDVTG